MTESNPSESVDPNQLERFADYLISEGFFTKKMHFQAPNDGGIFTVVENEDSQLKLAMSWRADDLWSFNFMQPTTGLKNLDRDAASHFLYLINKSYPFQNTMLVIDHSEVVSETIVRAVADNELVVQCILDMMSLSENICANVKFLNMSGSPYTDTQIAGVATLVQMAFNQERRNG